MTLLLLALFAAAPPGTVRVALNGHSFRLPAGYSLELAVKPSLVDRPVSAAFDERGRLFVTEVSGTNDPVKKQLVDRPHRLLCLEDTDGDGVFDKRTVFADRLMLPQGVLCKDGAVYVACPPSIWKFTEGKREEWFQGKTLTGCANDLHGPWAGPDGWIYWTKGAFAEQRYPRPGKPDLVTRASHVFRARPDGSGVEAVMTGGMDNPVGLAFLPGGERLFSCTFLQHPAGGKRDGLLHAVYGGVHGKDHNVLDGHVRTSQGFLPVMTHLGAAAPAGICLHRGDLFAALFNMHKITRHAVKPAGSTFTTEDSDFLTSDQFDFHPTDVAEAPDGSLLVVDTGGWYKLCCPTSQLHKPEALGAIYRIRGPAAKRAKPSDAAVWAACRKDDREAVRRFLDDADPVVRQAALHVVSLLRDERALPALKRLVADDSHPQNQRAAAEALGRIGGDMTAALLDALRRPADEVLFHSLAFALIESGDHSGLVGALDDKADAVRRAALIALDQRADGKLAVEAVLRELDGALSETAWWIAGRHPEWGERMAEAFRARLHRPEALAQLPRLAGSRGIQAMLAARLRDGSADEKRRVLEAMAAARLKAMPESWTKAVAAALADGDDKVVSAALSLPATATAKEALAALAADAARPAGLRLRAVQPGPLPAPLFALAVGQLKADADVAARSRAAEVLSKAALLPAQRLALARALPGAGPMELGRVLEAFAPSADEALGREVVAALTRSPVRSSLTADRVRAALARQGPAVQKEAATLVALIDAGAARQKEDLESLLASIGKGDVKRGQTVFNSPKAACASCHAIGYLGGKTGPDLSRIGGIRTERDLLEAIVFPSASFVRSYEPVRVRTVRGQALEGLVKQETPTHVVLAINATEEARIARKDIEEMVPGKVSIMPAGLDKVLTRQELADLVAFLRDRK